jgi:hypothetical protein
MITDGLGIQKLFSIVTIATLKIKKISTLLMVWSEQIDGRGTVCVTSLIFVRTMTANKRT